MRFALSLLLLCSTLQAATWPCKTVTYSDATPRRFHAATDAAFAKWGEASGLRFERVSSGGEIEISLYRDACRFTFGQTALSFDETGRISHATISLNRRAYAWRIYFYATVLHEIGHSIGLGESTELCAMNGAYHAQELSAGDIAAVRGLYGR